jgi:hypothetical protein
VLLDPKALACATASSKDNTPFKFETLSLLLESRIGSRLFADEAYKLQWIRFLEQCKSQLADIVHLNLDAAAVLDYKALMRRGTNDLCKIGFARFEAKQIDITWCAFSYCTTISNIDDQWALPLGLMITACGINSGHIPLLPWETHLLARHGGKMPSYPETLTPETSHMADSLAVRNVALKLIRAAGDETYADMLKTMLKHADALKQLQPLFWFHIDFLQTHLNTLVAKLVEEDLLAILPGSTILPGDKTLDDEDEIMTLLLALQRVPFVVASPATLVGSVANSAIIVKKVLQAEPPSDKELGTYSAFHKKVLDRCANFLRVQTLGTGKNCLKVTTTLLGKQAMLQLMTRLDAGGEKKDSATMDELKPFRQFKWLLTPDDQKKVQNLITEAAKKRRSDLELKALEDQPRKTLKVSHAKAGGKDGSKTSAESSDSTALRHVCLALGEATSSSSSAVATGLPKKDESETKKRLMSMFLPKK